MFLYFLHKINPFRLIVKPKCNDCLTNQSVSGSRHKVSFDSRRYTFAEISNKLVRLKNQDDGFETYVISRCGHKFPHRNAFNFWSTDSDSIFIDLLRVQDVGAYVSHEIQIKRSEISWLFKNINGIINEPTKYGFTKQNI